MPMNVVATTTPRGQFIAALNRQALPGRVPHFELEFFLTMEAFGKVHPGHRHYHQWLQMTSRERALHIEDMVELQLAWCRRYEWSALLISHACTWNDDLLFPILERFRALAGDSLFLMIHGDCTLGIPNGAQMEEMSLRMAEEPEKVCADAQKSLESAVARAKRIQAHGMLDGFALCSDYCFNEGPFLPLPWFDQFVTPYLHQLTRAYRELGFYVIKHTDGNIMPILDRLVPEDPTARPHALHSLDPQAGVDMAVIVDQVGAKVALCGNVDCGKLQTGTDAQCAASTRYALQHGLRAPGYIFCTSNCVYTGMELERYHLIHRIWQEEGIRR